MKSSQKEPSKAARLKQSVQAHSSIGKDLLTCWVEQGTGRREKGTRNREQGEGNKEQVRTI
jgi:hypothetical protein